jgi:excisionase family DNA binding protein
MNTASISNEFPLMIQAAVATGVHAALEARNKDREIIRGMGNLAKLLQVHRRTIERWKRANVIPYKQVGRVILFDKDEVFKALNIRYE